MRDDSTPAVSHSFRALGEYAVRFDYSFGLSAQGRTFREYLAGLLDPQDRNKTLTTLAAAEPVIGAQRCAVQRLRDGIW